jgi:hypothetical protein
MAQTIKHVHVATRKYHTVTMGIETLTAVLLVMNKLAAVVLK